MADNEISEEGQRARYARWEEVGFDAIKADLQAGGHQFVGGPPAVRRLAWKWVGEKEAEQREQPELFQLKPNDRGVGIDLKELGCRPRRFGRRTIRRFKR